MFNIRRPQIPILTLSFCLLLLALWLPVHGEDDESTSLSSRQKKIIVLIAASDNHPAFIDLQNIWRAYMNLMPEHVEAYFIKGDTAIKAENVLIGDTIYSKVNDNYKPGMLQKTVMSMEFLLDKIKQCDYVLRTNLSSFYHFPRLLAFLDTLPETGCYCAQAFTPSHADVTPEYYGVPFGWGAGFILSPDLVEMLVKGKQELLHDADKIPDDVKIGSFFFHRNIRIIPETVAMFSDYADWTRKKSHLSDTLFHFKAKKQYFARKPGDEYQDEYRILIELLDSFYPLIEEGSQESFTSSDSSPLNNFDEEEYLLMDKLALAAGLDKSSSFHHYTKVYSQYFKDVRNEPLKFLEIGIGEGNSAKFFENYFPLADLYFIDNTDEYIKYYSDRSKYFFIDQSDILSLQSFAVEEGPFDIILDDGGHTMTQQINSFLALFPFIKPGGLYIIEDLHTSYWQQFGGSGNCSKADEGTTVGFLKSLVDQVNFCGSVSGCADADKFHPGVETLMTYVRDNIQSIRFYTSVCIIEKK